MFENCSCSSAFLALNGGAIEIIGGGSANVISNCTFRGCRASGLGGAVDVRSSGGLTISDSTFENNTTSNSVVSAGSATNAKTRDLAAFGGAVHMHSGGKLMVSNCTFTGNRALKGGAIYHAGGSVGNPPDNYALVLSGCMFSDNQARTTILASDLNSVTNAFPTEPFHACGGAVAVSAGGLSVKNCDFIRNRAAAVNSRDKYGTKGGAILNSGALRAEGCTFTEN